MRFVVPAVVTSSLAILLGVMPSFITVMLDPKESHGQRIDSSTHPKPIDAVSLLQGTRIQLDRFSLQDVKDPQDAKDGTVFSIPLAPAPAMIERRSADTSMAKTLTGHALEVAAVFGSRSWDAYALRYRQLKGETGGIAFVMLVVLLGCTCLAVWSMTFPEKSGLGARGQRPPATPMMNRSVSGKDTRITLQPLSIPQLPSSRSLTQVSGSQPVLQSVINHKSPRHSDSSSHANFGSLVRASLATPMTASLAPSPLNTGPTLTLPPVRTSPLSPSVSVPPLCPTIVMPLVEARFGIPLLEINKLMKHGCGELMVVGLSTNPLLRAVVRREGSGRSLEIAMPDCNGVPRATLSPCPREYENGMAHATTLEIRGMRGTFYGFLVMTEQATYVTKEDQIVLSIGGQAASLQLVLTSNGIKAADVRCSSEAFGGIDHVELRVEPGVDTVLVLAVVLAVLLLSPWSAGEAR
mmetsp:Transcript_6483/g.10303  ORF Transcript_6483/g.10303 Transcript_6483/m.10303 type:complete len:466 (-) Transcript_6483:147-1544(-)